SGELSIAHDMLIRGPGATRLSVSGNDASRVFAIDHDAVAEIDGLTITHGRAGQGGGIFNVGHLTVKTSTFRGNQVTAVGEGGAIWNGSGAALELIDTALVDNLALGESAPGTFLGGGKGGGLFNAGEVTITRGTFNGNLALSTGGATATGRVGGW